MQSDLISGYKHYPTELILKTLMICIVHSYIIHNNFIYGIPPYMIYKVSCVYQVNDHACKYHVQSQMSTYVMLKLVEKQSSKIVNVNTKYVLDSK